MLVKWWEISAWSSSGSPICYWHPALQVRPCSECSTQKSLDCERWLPVDQDLPCSLIVLSTLQSWQEASFAIISLTKITIAHGTHPPCDRQCRSTAKRRVPQVTLEFKSTGWPCWTLWNVSSLAHNCSPLPHTHWWLPWGIMSEKQKIRETEWRGGNWGSEFFNLQRGICRVHQRRMMGKTQASTWLCHKVPEIRTSRIGWVKASSAAYTSMQQPAFHDVTIDQTLSNSAVSVCSLVTVENK